jgi:hypothetical protein
MTSCRAEPGAVAEIVGACDLLAVTTSNDGPTGRAIWISLGEARMIEAIMSRRISGLGACALCVALGGFVFAPGVAEAAPKAKPRSAAPSKAPKKNPKKAEPEADATSVDAKGDDDPADSKPDRGEPGAVKAAGTSATKAAPNASGTAAVKETKETKEGVKTYKFGTIEVESRLKSPQIIYFLRRVRAEFDAGLLGHRSFMRELSDTRNNPALR